MSKSDCINLHNARPVLSGSTDKKSKHMGHFMLMPQYSFFFIADRTFNSTSANYASVGRAPEAYGSLVCVSEFVIP